MNIAREILAVAFEVLSDGQVRNASVLRVPSSVSGRDKEKVERALEFLELGMKEKKIWNVDYISSKDILGRAVENGSKELWDKISDSFKDKDRLQRSQEDWDLIYAQPSGLNEVNSLPKKVRKYDGPLRKDIDEFIAEWLPLAQAVKAMKPFIVKGRKVDPNAPTKDRYEAPKTSTSGKALIVSALEKIVSSQAKTLVDNLTNNYLRWADEFLTERTEKESVYDFYKSAADISYVVQRLVFTESNIPRAPKEYSYRPNHTGIAKKMATDGVDDIVKKYLAKNTDKIGSVVEHKGDLKNIKISHGNLHGGGFAGELVCHFSDGTQFTVRNKVVYKMNERGKTFVQFPTTFHDITWADGKKSKMLSEKQMNEDWAKQVA